MIRIPYDTTLGAAARQMQEAHVTVVLVVDRDDVPIGVLTERHLLSSVAASRHPDHGTAASWMARVVIDADGHATLPETDASSHVGIGSPLRPGRSSDANSDHSGEERLADVWRVPVRSRLHRVRSPRSLRPGCRIPRVKVRESQEPEATGSVPRCGPGVTGGAVRSGA